MNTPDPVPSARPGSWYTIPGYRAFVDELAMGIIERWGSDPLSLSDLLVLVPNRRSARALTEALLAASGRKSLILPQIRTIGDLDEGEPPFEPGRISLELPPAIKPLTRLFELASLVSGFFESRGQTAGFAQCLDLAEALGQFLDSLQIEEITPPDSLHDLVIAEMAGHWELSADLLTLALEAWPRRLADLGLIDPMQRRTLLLKTLAEQWQTAPPLHPILAAGSTGSVKATADLLGVIARCPQGHVVLPGLDQGLDDAGWSVIEDQHPQYGLKSLLIRMGLTREDIHPWRPGTDTAGRWRQRIINESLRPADRTADWLAKIATLREESDKEGFDPVEEGLRGLTLIEADHEREAALTIALLMRETLETPNKRVALITPDKQMAGRVQSELARWGLTADVSSGLPLANSAPASLANLVCDWIISPLDPVLWLALLKHPLTRLGLARADFEESLKDLELSAFRKVRPTSKGMLLSRTRPDSPARHLAESVISTLGPLSWLDENPELPGLSDWVAALVPCLEQLTTDPVTGEPLIWNGPDGEAMAALMADLAVQDARLSMGDLTGLLSRLVRGQSINSDQIGHPELKILGTIEARLVGADRLILAGLEEGIWPQAPGIDPLLSRPLRAALGLPSPERRIGLSAHDFAQAASSPEVFMIHTSRREHAPSVPSRWLWRLKTLVKGAGLSLPGRPDLLRLARSLDSAEGPIVPVSRSAPCPPVEHRPRRLAVTRIEGLVNDPYGVWARDIAKLRVLDPPGGVFDVRGRGTAIHRAIELFSENWPYEDREAAAARFKELYLTELANAGARVTDLIQEQPLAARLGEWICSFEADRQPFIDRLYLEKEGRLTLSTGSGYFVLTAKSDRLELLRDGRVNVIDFKSGTPPAKSQVKAGYSPQLTLTAAIVEAGGFTALGPKPAGDLIYAKVSGRAKAGEVICVSDGSNSSDLAKDALAGLTRLIDRFDNPETPYLAAESSDGRGRINDYQHLSRQREWGQTDESEGDE